MKITIRILGLAAISVILSACASSQSANNAPARGGRYITLPSETGSRLPRRVWVNDDGTISDPGSFVQKVSPDALSDMQRKGSVNRSGGQ